MNAAVKVRILFVVGRLDVGGMERLVIDLIGGLDPERFEILICAIEGPGKLAYLLAAKGIEIVSLGKSQGLNLLTVLKLRRLIVERNVSLIHTHNSAAHFYAAFANRLLFRRVPLVHTKHGRDSPNNMRSVLRNRLCSSLSDVIVPVSDDIKCLCIETERVPAHKLKTVINGIELAEYLRAAESRVLRNEFVFGHVGRLDSVKNQQMLLKVFQRFLDVFPNSELVLVGDGPLRKSLELQSSELGISGKTTFLGYRSDMPNVLMGFDCFVMSSVSEGTPLAVIEAMATGCPVIATDVGGMREIVRDGENGYLVPSGDNDKMLERWLQVAEDKERCREMGIVGQETAISNYGLERMVSDYHDIYFSLLEF